MEIFIQTIFSIFIILYFCPTDCQVLKGLFIVHRHGDRLTEYSNSVCPNNKYTIEIEKNYSDEIGQLTVIGKRRMFNIGKFFLRKKYAELLDSYLKIDIKSSDKDRCIESSQVNLI